MDIGYAGSAPAEPSRIVFLANDATYFFRHFVPALEAAADVQADIVALLPEAPDASTRKRFSGAMNVIRTAHAQRDNPVWAFANTALSLLAILRRVRPDIIVGYSVRSIVLLIIAFPWLRAKRYVFVVTGLGTTDIVDSRKSKFLRSVFYLLMRWINHSAKVWFIFENHSDATRIGIPPHIRTRHLTVMGAGVDPDEFRPEPRPPHKPLRLAAVGRLVWSKGMDLAAKAVSSLVDDGYDLSLDIFGRSDPANPLPVAETEVTEWTRTLSGIRYHGHVEDVPRIWREHHIGIFPTRGGEGLPRVLLEASACGVPTIVTRVPGCEDFVRDGVEGFVVRPDSVEELKLAIKRFIDEPELIARLGHASRERVMQTATSKIVKQAYVSIFRLGAEQTASHPVASPEQTADQHVAASDIMAERRSTMSDLQ